MVNRAGTTKATAYYNVQFLTYRATGESVVGFV